MFIFLDTFNSEFSYIEVWLTDQNSIPLVMMMRHSNQFWGTIFVKGYEFLSLSKNMGRNIGKNIRKNLRGKYKQILPDRAKQSTTDALKITSKK